MPLDEDDKRRAVRNSYGYGADVRWSSIGVQQQEMDTKEDSAVPPNLDAKSRIENMVLSKSSRLHPSADQRAKRQSNPELDLAGRLSHRCKTAQLPSKNRRP